MDAAETLTDSIQSAINLAVEIHGKAVTDGAIILAQTRILATVLEGYPHERQQELIRGIELQIRSWLKGDIH